MATGRELVSEVRSLNKLINSDNNITDRLIYNILKDSATLLIKRETNLRRLWNSPIIFTTIPCLEMIPVPLSECCDYKNPCMVSRSVKKIPNISEGIFGLLIQSVFSPGRKKFDYSTIDRFINILGLKLKNTKKYFWIYNEYLYVSDPDIEYVDITAYFDKDINPADYAACQSVEDLSCVNPLDMQFKVPSYLEKNLRDLVNDELNKTYFRHIVDPQTNAKDEEQS